MGFLRAKYAKNSTFFIELVSHRKLLSYFWPELWPMSFLFGALV